MLDNARRYELVVRPRGRNPADEYFHNGAIWIEGREGNNYVIDIRNNTHNRVLFIVSVDGLDVLNGQPAGPNSQGYIVNAYDMLSIPGWKLNNQEAAEFFFSRSRDSYVNAIGGSTANTGVIGAMVFSEYQHQLDVYSVTTTSPGVPYNTTDKSWVIGSNVNTTLTANSVRRIVASTPMMASKSYHQVVGPHGNVGTQGPAGVGHTSSPVSQDVGTGFGNATGWKTNEITFQRANPNQPDAVLAVYYNTARNLEKMGIRLRKKRDVSYQANPFPAYSTGCKPPNDWQG